ncbi:hypothetical protein BD410DRAFT_902018 [Rickenella mellea]|uniref:Nucleoporin Nup159/Nup146 N-terminal domain-containing protein n=1 Tax=Rickenella mellea TaxID=50990 RepID=A0A4Y7PN04_9AGAM|nr:hypothetical protein BD410DRAFT_902018 [Rickenella mellea]
MNVNTLASPPHISTPRTHTDATEKDAEFLSLRLLNKRIRIRLSPEPLNLGTVDGKCTWFAVSNTKGWFAAVTGQRTEFRIILSTLQDLRSTLLTSTAEEGEVPLQPRRTLVFRHETIHHIVFAFNDERLVVGFDRGSVKIYDTAQLFQPGPEEIPPLQTFPAKNSGILRQVLPNPGDIPELVAIRREQDGLPNTQTVEILDVKAASSVGGWCDGNTPDAFVTSINWSAKGKQLAIGLQGGDIVTYSPSDTGTMKLHIVKPPQLEGCSLISTSWLSNPAFYCIYAPPGQLQPEADQRYYLVSYDSKSRSATDIKLSTPCFPSPALRPPGSFTVVLRNWKPAKFLVFVGDSPSSDIGLIGCIEDAGSEQETWCNLTLEETSTPSLPLDSESNDTILIGLELDLTNTQPLKAGDERPDHPPPPIMYAYASDGTIQAWYVINSEGEAYPGMIGEVAAATTSGPTTPKPAFASPTFASSPPNRSPFAQTTSPTFGQASFGQVTGSPFGQQSPQSTSVFGQPSAFGQTSSMGIGQTTSAFSNVPSNPPFGQQATSGFGSGGFGAFSSQAPTKFGSTGFVFGSGPNTLAASPMAIAPSASMADETDAPPAEMAEEGNAGFGGLSLGGGSEPKAKTEGGIFGSFAQPSTTVQPQSAFGTTGFGGSIVKPASGFGAFSNLGNQSQSTTTPAPPNPEPSKPSSAFGTSSFGAKPQSGFGQTAFGQSSFGQPAFGSSGFGSSTPSTTAAATPTATGWAKGGGFGAFAQGGPSSFASLAAPKQQAAEPAQANAPEQKPVSAFGTAQSSSAFGGGQSAFASQTTSSPAPAPAFAADQKPVSAFGVPEPSKPFSAFGSQPISHLASVMAPEQKPVAAFGASEPTKPFSAFGSLPTSGNARTSAIPARVTSPDSSPDATPMSSPKVNAGNALFQFPESPPEKPRTLPNVGTPNTTSVFGQKDSPQSVTSSPSPATSPFKSSTPASGFGAFGGLKTTPSAFKPAEGFGAFGAASSTSSSPFLNPKPAEGGSPFGAKSVFGEGGSGSATTTLSSTTPTFGAATAFGTSGLKQPVFGASAFGSPVPSVSATPTKPTPSATTGGAFSAFSGTSGSFTALSSASKQSSFGELLRTKDEKKDIAPAPVSAFAPISSLPPKPEESASAVQSTADGSASLSLSGISESSYVQVGEDAGSEQGEEEYDEDDDGSSFLTESSEGAHSVPGEEEEEEEEEEHKYPPPIPEEPEDEEEEEEEEEEDAQVESEKKVIDPADVRLPSTPRDLTPQPSTSATPKHEPQTIPLPTTPKESSPQPWPSPPPKDGPLPSIKVEPTSLDVRGRSETEPITKASSPSPVRASPEPGAKALSPPMSRKSSNEAQEESTTPPGSPQKDGQSVSSPIPITPSSVSLGLGRPTARPTRSSPLSSNVVAETSSTSIPLKPKPASPKKPFGQLPTAAPKSESQVQSTTPGAVSKTPEAAPAFPKFGTAPSKPFSLGGFSLPPAPSGSSIFSPTTPAGRSPSPASTTPSITPIFKFPPAPQSPATPTAPASPFGAGVAKPGTPPFSLLPPSTSGSTTPKTTPFGASKPFTPPPLPQAQENLSPMQKEFQDLYLIMNRDLETVQKMVQELSRLIERLSKPHGKAHVKADLGDSTKWTSGDLELFGKIMHTLESDILEIYNSKGALMQSMCEVESNLLKAETRKEEIVRFSRAKADPEFAKMLKVRTLGPEHAETQTLLRKQIRSINDRVEQLEDHLQSCMKKLSEYRTGKPSFRPPSLDTINRTFRNIDAAIEQQSSQIDILTARISKLHLTSSSLNLSTHSSPSTRDKRLPDVISHRPFHITPSVAASTAAALNAERSAHRLKSALARLGRVPEINRQAVSPVGKVNVLEWSTAGSKIGAGGAGPLPLPSTPLRPLGNLFGSDMSLSDSASSYAHSETRRERVPSRHNAHQKAVPLKKSPGAGSGVVASFDWGPLPGVPPATSLSPDVRPDKGKGKA